MLTVNIGDVVRLGINTPWMIVERADVDDASVTCIWFDQNLRLQRERFQRAFIKEIRS